MTARGIVLRRVSDGNGGDQWGMIHGLSQKLHGPTADEIKYPLRACSMKDRSSFSLVSVIDAALPPRIGCFSGDPVMEQLELVWQSVKRMILGEKEKSKSILSIVNS